MKKIIAVVLAIILLLSGGLFALVKAGVFSRDKAEVEAAAPTEEEELTPEMHDALDEQTADNGISQDDPLYEAKITLKVNVTDEDLKKYVIDYLKTFQDSSMPSRNKERTTAASKVGWGEEGMAMYDAVSFPFSTVEKGKKKYTDAEIDQMVDELREEIRRNPVVGMMVLDGMKYMALTDGTKVADLNSDWVNNALDLYDEYGVGVWLTYHTKYWETYGFELPHDGQSVEEWRAAHPDAPEVTKELMELIVVEEKAPIETGNDLESRYGRSGQVQQPTGPEYQLYISEEDPNNYDKLSKQILMWFDRLNCEGVETYTTSTFWYLNSTLDANKVKAIRNTDKDRSESLPSLNFSIRFKDNNGKTRQVFFGFNIYDMRLEIFERTAKPTAEVQPKSTPKPTGKTSTPTPSGKTNPPTPSGGTNPPNPNPGTNPNPPDPNPPTPPVPVTPKKDDGDGSVHQGNADKGGGEGQGKTPDKPVEDPSQNDMQDAGGGSDHNQGHSNPETVTPDTPPASDTGHTDNPAGSGENGNNAPPDDHNEETVENTNESQMDYGKEEPAQKNDDVDTGGSGAAPGTDSDMSNDNNDSAISEPGV
ncbi:hypothetical protein IJF91_02500 [Candidatus Saccharibacteria bacterium]|nr:hypothetical protein [Candidatus Saccharibacteria bacterium]